MTQQPDAVAFLTLLPSAEGGREGATPDGWFSCTMVVEGASFDVRLKTVGPLEPGALATVGVYFLEPARASRAVTVGTSFELKEIGMIGRGRVTQVQEAEALHG